MMDKRPFEHCLIEPFLLQKLLFTLPFLNSISFFTLILTSISLQFSHTIFLQKNFPDLDYCNRMICFLPDYCYFLVAVCCQVQEVVCNLFLVEVVVAFVMEVQELWEVGVGFFTQPFSHFENSYYQRKNPFYCEQQLQENHLRLK